MFRMLWVLVIGSAALAAMAGSAEGRTYRAGDKVVVVADGKLLVDGRTEVDDVWPGLVLTVTDVNRGWLWLSNGKPGWLEVTKVIPLDRRAIDRLTAMLRANPSSARLYNGRANVWSNLGELDIAIADLNEAIRLDPSAPHYTCRGNAWSRKQDHDKALRDYHEALRLDPKHAPAYVSRGIAWTKKGDYDKAIRDNDEALRLDPKFTTAYVSRGVAWTKKGDYDKAIRD
ncbi:MAG: hypothetical protein C0483_04165, partial [Pirellula sp.]|nr:hypothetical protein [Pirellula sp.]